MSIAGIQGVKISRGMQNTPKLHCLGLVFVTFVKISTSLQQWSSEKSATQYKCFVLFFVGKNQQQSPLRLVQIILEESLKVSGYISISSLPWFRHIYTSSQWNQQIWCFLQPKTIFPCHWLLQLLPLFGSSQKEIIAEQHFFRHFSTRHLQEVIAEFLSTISCGLKRNNRSWTPPQKMESSTSNFPSLGDLFYLTQLPQTWNVCIENCIPQLPFGGFRSCEFVIIWPESSNCNNHFTISKWELQGIPMYQWRVQPQSLKNSPTRHSDHRFSESPHIVQGITPTVVHFRCASLPYKSCCWGWRCIGFFII